MNEFDIDVRRCGIFFHNKDEKRSTYGQKYAHYGFFHRTMNFMRSMGYSVEKDPEVMKRFKRIAYANWYGRKGNLEFKGEFYPAGFKIVFFQNVNFENRNGGRYDSDKWDKMPYSIRLEMINTMRHIRDFFGGFPLKDVSDPVCDDAESQVKLRFVQSCHHPQNSMDFDLHDLDGTKGSEYKQNNLDRDGKEILNGQIKYTRDYHGYLVRGRVYYDLNMNWVVILNKNKWFVRLCWELFDLNDSDVRGRDHPKKTPPKEYRQNMELLHGMKTSWLEKELRRRKKADHENG